MVAFAIGAMVATLPTQARGETASVSAIKKKHPAHRRTVTERSPTQQIACTFLGCQPIPRNCHPEQGYYFDGTPTGYDIAVCR